MILIGMGRACRQFSMIDGLAGNWKSFQRFQRLQMNLDWERYLYVTQLYYSTRHSQNKECCRKPVEVLFYTQNARVSVPQSRQSAQLFLHLSEFGLPHPLTHKRVFLPPWTQRGRGSNTLLRVRGWADLIRTTG